MFEIWTLLQSYCSKHSSKQIFIVMAAAALGVVVVVHI
jgi:hypothetical protein